MSYQKAVFIRPSKEIIVVFWKWVAIVLSIFLVTYLTANQLAEHNTNRYHMYSDWELGIPLVPWMILVYLSYVAVFLLLPLVVKSGHAITSLAYGFLAAILVSTMVFVAFPGELGYHRPDYISEFDYLFQLLYDVDKPHNLFPSLHVTFSSLTAFAMMHQNKVSWFRLTVLVHVDCGFCYPCSPASPF